MRLKLGPRAARALAEALAARLGPVGPMAMDDPAAELAALARPELALAMDTAVEKGLARPGVEGLAGPFRGGPRRVTRDGLAFCDLRCCTSRTPRTLCG